MFSNRFWRTQRQVLIKIGACGTAYAAMARFGPPNKKPKPIIININRGAKRGDTSAGTPAYAGPFPYNKRQI